MKPIGIKSAQLLMEVTAGAQDKIGQEISKSGFSQQLSEQHQLIQNTPFGQLEGIIDQTNQSQNPSARSKEILLPLSSGIGAKVSEQGSNCSSKVTGSSLRSASGSDLAMSKWKIAHELTFTDSMALEKVLVQFNLAPSVRTTVKNALNDQGQISLHKLNEILDRAASSKGDLPADGKAATDEIQSLLTGMVQQQQSSVQNLKQLGIRLKGSYDLGEFRELLRRLVDKTASGKLDQAARSPLKRTTETNSATDNSAANASFTSRARLPNQTQSLTANLIPSFLRGEQEQSHDAKSSTLIATPPVSNGNGTSKISVLAVDETGQKEGLFGEQGPKQFNGAAKSLNTDVDSATLASTNSVAGGLQRVSSASISGTFLGTLPEVITDSASETNTLSTEGLQPTKVIESNIIPAANSNPDLPSIYSEGHQQTATCSSVNVASNGEAVIRGLRMGIPNALNSDNNLVDGALSNRSSTLAVEKTAAPASANFTSNQSDSSGNRAFSSNDTATVSPNDVPGRPAECTEEVFRDVIRFRIEPSSTDMRQNVADSNPASIGQADKPIQNGTYPGSNGNSDFSFQSQTASKSLDDGVNNLASLPQDHTEKQNSTEANGIPGQSDAGKPSIAATSASTEIRSNVNALFSQETLSEEASTDLKNSVELLARSEDASEATAARNGPASKEAADQAARSTSLETSVKEATTDKNAEKVAPAAHTSDQFTGQGQDQESALSFFRDGVQMMSAAAAPSAQTGAEMFSYYTSSLAGELAQRIQDLYQQKGLQFTMELQPKHLGRLVVRIGTDANQVKALISTESEQAREFLSKSAPLLRQELASQGLILEQLQIDVNSQATARDQFFQKRSQGNRRNGGSKELATSAKGAAKSSAGRSQIGHADTLISLFA